MVCSRIYLVVIFLTEWSLVVLSNFCTITKANIGNKLVVSLKPSVARKQLSKRFKHTHFIQDIVFCPSIFCAYDTDGHFLDDDHFCSRLCDRGYRVHICLPASNSTLPINTVSSLLNQPMIRQTNFYKSKEVSSSTKYNSGRDGHNNESEDERKMTFLKPLIQHLNLRLSTTALIAQEVSVPSLLRHLSDAIPTPSKSGGQDSSSSSSSSSEVSSRSVGSVPEPLQSELPAAVVLTDPPPLIPLYSDAERTRLLNDRFSTQVKDMLARYVSCKVSTTHFFYVNE